MDKVKLLYATEAAGGGTLKHVTYLATHLNKDEFDVTVILPSENYEIETQSVISVLKKTRLK